MKKFKKSIIEKYLYVWLLLPCFAVISLLTIYPFKYLIELSLYTKTFYNPGKFVGFSNYIKILLDPTFIQSIRVTLIFVSTSTTIELLWGLGLALMLSKVSGRAIQIVRGCFIIPLILMPIAVASIWQLMYFPVEGIINVIFGILNLPSQQWLSTEMALPCIILVEVWEFTPFTILVLLSGIKSIPLELYEASAIDGASGWQNIRYITIPLLKPFFGLCIIFNIMRQVKTFDVVYTLTRGGPRKATDLISYEIYQRAYRIYKISDAAVISVLLLAAVIILAIILVNHMKKVSGGG